MDCDVWLHATVTFNRKCLGVFLSMKVACQWNDKNSKISEKSQHSKGQNKQKTWGEARVGMAVKYLPFDGTEIKVNDDCIVAEENLFMAQYKHVKHV